MMSDIDIPQTFFDDVADCTRSFVAVGVVHWAKKTDSPIEALFLAAFETLCLLHRHKVFVDTKPTQMSGWLILPQHQIGKYRVDFLIGDGTIVECDGAQFHYASWDQIDRDRKRDTILEAQGYKVFRFPGTQICSAPMAAASEVFEWLEGHDKTYLKKQQAALGFTVRPTEEKILKALFEAQARHGKFVSSAQDGPPTAIGKTVVTWKHYRDVAIAHRPEISARAKAGIMVRKEFKISSRFLIKAGVVGFDPPHIWWTGKPVRGFAGTFPSGHDPECILDQILLSSEEIVL